MLVKWGFPIVREAEGGGSAPPPPASLEVTTNVATPPPAVDPPPPAPAERPTWLPEGMADGETLAKSYTELRTAFSGKTDALKADLLKELRTGVPEKPDDYALEVPADLLPEGFKAEINPKDPFLAEMKGFMHELGAKPDQWQKMTNAFLRWQVGHMPDVMAEQAKLGEGAPERIAAVDMWLAKALPAEQYKAVAAGMVTAEGVAALETLMRQVTGGVPPVPGGAAGAATLTGDQAMSLMAKPEYRQDSPEGRQLREQVAGFIAKGGRLPGQSGGFGR